MYMAQNALTQWMEYLLDEKEAIPVASNIKSFHPTENQFISLVRAEIRNNQAVRRTVSIPGWLDEKASSANISLSKVLQEALKDRLGVQ
jgi:hypothetical protein